MENEALESKSGGTQAPEPPKEKKKTPSKTIGVIALLLLVLLPLIIVSISNASKVYLYVNGFAEGIGGTLHFVKGHRYLVNSEGEYTVPSSFNGRPVTVIDAYAFENNKKLRHLTVEEGITSISEYAFAGCHALETVSLPSTLTDIYSGVFWDCISLEEITLPRELERLCSYAFAGCESLTRVTLPKEYTTNFDGTAFLNCQSIVEFVCPSGSPFTFDRELGLLLAGDSILLFQNINNLEELILPEGVSYIIQANAFLNHPELRKIYIPKGVFLRKDAFLACPSLTVYCEASEWSSWFDAGWNPENIPVVYDSPLGA